MAAPPNIDPKKTALIIVDVQNDFMPTGSLGVFMGTEAKEAMKVLTAGADAKSSVAKDVVRKVITQYTADVTRVANEAKALGVTIVTTQDWHPVEHPSFSKKGGIWPDHCVQGTNGAAYSTGLFERTGDSIVDVKVLKGMSDIGNGYSGFGEKTGTSIEILDAYPSIGVELSDRKIDTLLVCGVATEYCVKSTAIDGKALTQEKLLRLKEHAKYLKEKYFSPGSGRNHVDQLSVAEQLEAKAALEKLDAKLPKTNGNASEEVFKRVIVVEGLIHPVTAEGGDKCKTQELPEHRVELATWEQIKKQFIAA